MVDPRGEPAPEFISLSIADGGNTLVIQVDVKEYSDSSQVLQLFVMAKLVDYPQVSIMKSEFKLEILVAEKFVFAPPPQPASRPKQ